MIEKMLVCSTGNISYQTALWLDYHGAGAYAKDNGWFISVQPFDPETTFPEDLTAALDLARVEDCQWLLLDNAAPLHPQLEEFNW